MRRNVVTALAVIVAVIVIVQPTGAGIGLIVAIVGGLVVLEIERITDKLDRR